MKALQLPRADWPLVAAGALLTVLAYPPFHLFLPSFVSLVPAVWLLTAGRSDPRPLRRQMVQGFWLGLASNSLVLYWIVIALWHFTPLSAAGYAVTVIILGMFTAILFGAVGWLERRGIPLLAAFPVLWTALDWLIGHLGDVAFPWLGLGTSLTAYPVVIQIADIVGARGLTFLLALANVALALAWLDRRRIRHALGLAGGVVAGLLAAIGYGVYRERTIPLHPVARVAVIQPNEGFEEKWVPGLADSIFDAVLGLSERAIRDTHPDIVVWPEAAVPGYFVNHRSWDRRIAAQAGAAHVPLLVGGLDATPSGDARDPWLIWNAAFVYDSDGSRAGNPVYHKHYLVPITERVPFLPPRWFHLPFFGSFSVGAPGDLYDTGFGKFGILICYEDIFENVARRYRRMGAEIGFNITNDAWFGHTAAPYQHFAHLVMRAVENRMGFARAANDGISGFIDPLGRAYHRTALGGPTLAADEVLGTDVVPLYTRLGDWVGLGSVFATLALVAFGWRRRP